MAEKNSPYHKGLCKISVLLDNVTKPIFKKRGFYENKLITDWPMIVGAALAPYTIPQKIVSRMVQGQREGVLYVDVTNSGVAMQLQFMEPVLLEKIAVYFGFRAISSFKIRQRPHHPDPVKEIVPIALSAAENQLLERLTDDIKDKDLQASLKELGKYIVSNHHQ
jgi:hypothetical protein